MLPIEKMLIHITFNQLEYWMDIQRQKIIDLIVKSSEIETAQGMQELKAT